MKHRTKLTVAILGGSATSFFVFLLLPYLQFSGKTAQLIAGDPRINRELPTTLNAFQGAVDGTSPMIASLSSYGFWVAVVFGAVMASLVLLRLLRNVG